MTTLIRPINKLAQIQVSSAQQFIVNATNPQIELNTNEAIQKSRNTPFVNYIVFSNLPEKFIEAVEKHGLADELKNEIRRCKDMKMTFPKHTDPVKRFVSFLKRHSRNY